MSADLQSALLDILAWLYRGFFLPGDRLLANFPGLYLSSHGYVVTGLVCAVIWLAVIVLLVAIWRFIRYLDSALTAFIMRAYEELQRAVRVVARRTRLALRSYALERAARLARPEVSELPALSGVQLEILQHHAALPPGHLVTPADIANTLAMRVADVERALGALRNLTLVERTFGAGDGEDGYRLTRAGAVLLAACSQRSAGSKRIEPTLGSA
jgi:DNA-binding MarR family transcriptional regulator